jgi:SAM-dependent methyltransferase
VALACAARGAEADACDLSAALVERGAARTGQPVRWRHADVQALPYADAAFDVVVSAFGAALAPRPKRTVSELARVLRPGGRLVLAAWVPRGLPGRLEELHPPPDGIRPAGAWADDATARARFEPWFDAVERRLRTVALTFPGADSLFAALAGPYGLSDADRPAFDRLLAAQNNRPPEAHVDARYVLYAGDRRG